MYDQSKDTYHHFKLTTRSMSQSWYCSINRNGCVLHTSVWKPVKHTGTTFSEIVCKQFIVFHDLFQCHANRFTHLFKISVISVEILNHMSDSGFYVSFPHYQLQKKD